LIKKLDEMFKQLEGTNKGILSVAAAHDDEVLMAIKDAVERGIITPILAMTRL